MRTTSSLWLLGMVEQFRAMDLPVPDLLKEANISLQALTNPSLRIPQDNVSVLWNEAAKASDLEAIGLHLGQQLSLATTPILLAGILQCSSAVAGINLIIRHQKMIGEVSNIRMTELPSKETERAEMRLDFLFFDDQQPLSPHTWDVAMASAVRVVRLIEGQHWKPDLVQLRRQVKCQDNHREFFGCEVRFGEDCDRIVFEIEKGKGISTAKRLPWSQRRDVDIQDSTRVLSDMISMILPEQLRSGEFKRSDIARLFNISERTLQRRLASEGRRYTDLLDNVRKEQSAALINSPDYTQMEVAFLCGFADVSSFHHAFQRWYQVPPGQYREEQ